MCRYGTGARPNIPALTSGEIMIRVLLQGAFVATLVAGYKDLIARYARKDTLPTVTAAQQRQRLIGTMPAVEFRRRRGRNRAGVLEIFLITGHGEYKLGTRDEFRVRACADLLAQRPPEDERIFIELLAPEVGEDGSRLGANTGQLRDKIGYLAALGFLANPMVDHLGKLVDVGD
jgi:hypothetical protein